MEGGTILYYPPEGGEETLSGMSPAAIRKLGIKLSFVPEDRLGMGLVAAMGMTDNMMLRGYKKGMPFFTDRKTPKAMAEQLIKELEIVTPGVSTPVGRLSGGNVQKVLVSGHRKYIFSEESISIKSEIAEGVNLWTAYKDWGFYENYIYIRNLSNQVILVRQSELSAEDHAWLVDLLTRHLGAALV